MFGAFPGAGRPGQQQAQQQGQPLLGQAPQRQPAVRKVAAAIKAPRYDEDSGFDLYRARLESFLRQRDCWNVVIGAEGPDDQNAERQRVYEERNLFARDTLLFGLLPKDAKKVCRHVRVSEMWTAFEREQTRRDFANSVHIRGKMYGAKYVTGMNMDKYLETLEDYRRRLDNMNDHIRDPEMAGIILAGVEGTHRNVVRMFNGDANAPDLDRVLNTLRSEAEMDEAEEERNGLSKKKKGGSMIGSVKKGKPWQRKKQNKVGPGKKAQGGGTWKETRECHFCHKVGHLQANCRKKIAEQKQNNNHKDDSDDDDTEAPAQSKNSNLKKKNSRKIGFLGQWTKPSGTIGMVRSSSVVESPSEILACSPNKFAEEWMLDTGTDVHVCRSAESFQHELLEDDKIFNDWKGGSAKAEGIGLVQIPDNQRVGPGRR